MKKLIDRFNDMAAGVAGMEGTRGSQRTAHRYRHAISIRELLEHDPRAADGDGGVGTPSSSRAQGRRMFQLFWRPLPVAFSVLLSLIAILWTRAPVLGTELGLDVGVNIKLGSRPSEIGLTIPASNSVEAPSVQCVRVGLETSPSGQVEFAPGLAISSSKYWYGRITTTRLGLAVSYLWGRQHSEKLSPYARIGGQYGLVSETGPDSLASIGGTLSRFGLAGGAGIRWGLGRVAGVRGEVVALRWFAGDFPSSWELAVRGGVSALLR